MSFSRAFVFIAALAVLYSQSCGVYAGDVDPKAQMEIDRMVSAYNSLRSFSCSIDVASSVSKSPITYNLAVRRPGSALVRCKQTGVAAASDGVRVTETKPEGNETRYKSDYAPPGAKAIDVAFSTVGYNGPLSRLLTSSRNPLSQFGRVDALCIKGSDAIDGRKVMRIEAKVLAVSTEYTVSYLVDEADHLLRQSTIERREGNQASTTTETYTFVKVNPVVPDSTFRIDRPTPLSAKKDSPLDLVGGSSGAPALGDSYRYDFGDIEIGKVDKLEHVFILRNSSGYPVKITRLHASCGCTSAIAERGNQSDGTSDLPITLLPGQQVNIRVSLNTVPRVPGTFEKTVAVFAEGATEPITNLGISGKAVVSGSKVDAR